MWLGRFCSLCGEKLWRSGSWRYYLKRTSSNMRKKLRKDLPVEIRLQDYRDINEHFDRIVSVGMFEHVGYKNYQTFHAQLLIDY